MTVKERKYPNVENIQNKEIMGVNKYSSIKGNNWWQGNPFLENYDTEIKSTIKKGKYWKAIKSSSEPAHQPVVRVFIETSLG